MTALNIKNKKVNPKKRKRKTFVNPGKPKVGLNSRIKKVKHEQLKNWKSAS